MFELRSQHKKMMRSFYHWNGKQNSKESGKKQIKGEEKGKGKEDEWETGKEEGEGRREWNTADRELMRIADDNHLTRVDVDSSVLLFHFLV